MDLPKKFKISFKDNFFENLDALIRVLGASDLMSLVDGSRLIPQATTNYKNGCIVVHDSYVHTITILLML